MDVQHDVQFHDVSKPCTGCSVQGTVYRVQCTGCSVQGAVYSIQCTVYSVQCTGCIQGAVYTLRTVHSSLNIAVSEQ